MILLNREQAIQAMRDGKTIGFVGIQGVEMALHDGNWLFMHRDGSIENLRAETIAELDGYCIRNYSNRHMKIKTRRFHSL